KAPHQVDSLPSDVRREHRTKPVPPQPHRLVAQVNPTLKKQVLNISQRQRKTDVHHDYKPDYLGRGMEISEWAGRFARSRHATALPDQARIANWCICFDSALTRIASSYQGAVILTYEDCQSRLLARSSGSGDVVHRRNAGTKSSGRD
ncbi:MAG: hypothetical protein ABJA20_15505, partial [Novosphingobium sp.]